MQIFPEWNCRSGTSESLTNYGAHAFIDGGSPHLRQRFVVSITGHALSCRRRFHLQGSGLRELPNSLTRKEVTREKFASFLEWLSPNRDRAGEEYERLRFRLCTFFSQRQCTFADELADETINRVILKISEEKIENRIGYCYGVAKNIYREWLRKQRTHLDIDDVVIAAKVPEEQSVSSECLDKCLGQLPTANRSLLLDYFSEAKQAKIELHQRISESMRTTQTALRMRIMRSKQKLKICVQECMG
jgi:DNA-directed RNA polymerase specialized sigma24 family protein